MSDPANLTDAPTSDHRAELELTQTGSTEAAPVRGEIDIQVTPVRACKTPADVSLTISINGFDVKVPLIEDEALALEDMLQQALEAEPLP